MSPDRPLVILAGPINAAGHANLEREARVVLCEDETEAGFIKVAAQAQGILFRTKPRCTESLMAACKQLKVVGRHGVGPRHGRHPGRHQARRRGRARAGLQLAGGGRARADADAGQRQAHGADRPDDAQQATGAAARDSQNTELAGKTLGIIGVGNVGRRVAKFAGALGMRVLGYDPYVPDDELQRRGVEPVKSLRGAPAAGGRAHLPHAADARDQAHDQPHDARAHEEGRDLHQHVARRRAAGRGRSSRRSPAASSAAAGIDVWEEEPAVARQQALQPRQRRVLLPRGRRHQGSVPAGLAAGHRARCCACCAARCPTCS